MRTYLFSILQFENIKCYTKGGIIFVRGEIGMNNRILLWISFIAFGAGIFQQLGAVVYTFSNLSNKTVDVSVDYEKGAACFSDRMTLGPTTGTGLNNGGDAVKDITKYCGITMISVWFRDPVTGKTHSFGSSTKYFSQWGNERFEIEVDAHNNDVVITMANKKSKMAGTNRLS